jgi:ribonuclease-3
VDQASKLNALQKRIAYSFKQNELLQQALTHKSAQAEHNERLEFLGDSILNTSITIYLFENFPHLDEGYLSRVRANLVKGETLAKIAKEKEIGECLILGTGELKSGGYKRASILADALEALMGAVFLDSDFETAEQFVITLYQERLNKEAVEVLGKDSKSALQEYLQSKQLPLPLYEVDKVHGKDHDQRFTVSCKIEALNIEASSTASNRRKAEKAVAAQLLEQINQGIEK